MSTLINFYYFHPITKYVMVLLSWFFWPGLRFIVGFIAESRIIPIGRDQSKAFLPGDMSFGIIFVTMIGLYKPGEQFNTKLCCILFLPVLYFAYIMRKNDAPAYPPRARISPTKLTHDIIGYFIIPLVLLTLGLTKLFAILSRKESLMDSFAQWMVIVAFLLFYIICVVVDEEQPATPEQIHARHPEDWRPIWKRDSR